VLWLFTRQLFSHPAFARTNYRDRSLPTSVGVLLPVTLAAVVALAALVKSRPPKVLSWDALVVVGPTVLGLCAGFALLGLIDDLGGVGQSGGFTSHLRALSRGQLTTGAIKLLGGPVVALAMLASTPYAEHRPGLLRDAALICLAANLANLLDRAPGRVAKSGAVAFVVLWGVTGFGQHILSPVAVVIGGMVGLAIPDLREKAMLGDAGSNAIGAVLGFGVVLTTTTTARWWVLGALAVLNVASELISFSRVIDAVPPLRFVDRLGTPRREVAATVGPPEVS
jgi:UDP-N-acetylmuramyl pentapeptide phosphotransferase/UDP-N-acetylglucosamine-1-phosphate transferase